MQRPTSPVKWQKPKPSQKGKRIRLPEPQEVKTSKKDAIPTRAENRAFDMAMEGNTLTNVPDNLNPKKVGKKQARINMLKELEKAAAKDRLKKPKRMRGQSRQRMEPGGSLEIGSRQELAEEFKGKSFDEIGKILKMDPDEVNLSTADQRTANYLGYSEYEYAVLQRVTDIAKSRSSSITVDGTRFKPSYTSQERKKDYKQQKKRAITQNYEAEIGELSNEEYRQIYGDRDSQQRITGGRLKTDNPAGKTSIKQQFKEGRARRGRGDTRVRPRKDDRVRKAVAGKAPAPNGSQSLPKRKRINPRRFKAQGNNPNRTVPIGRTVLDTGAGLQQQRPGSRIRNRVQNRRGRKIRR